MFLNDETLPYEVVVRQSLPVITKSDGDHFVVYDVNGISMIESLNHYSRNDLDSIFLSKFSRADIAKLVEDGHIIKLSDEYTPDPTKSEEDNIKIKAMFDRRNGNVQRGFSLDLLKKYWTELYVDGLEHKGDGDGDTSIHIAEYIRATYDLSVDTTSEVGFNEYIYTMNTLYQSDNDEDDEVFVRSMGTTYAGSIDDILIDTNWMTGRFASFGIETTTLFRGEVRTEVTWVRINERGFTPRMVADHVVSPLSADLKAELSDRGKLVIDGISDNGISFVQYEGEGLIPFFFGPYPEYVNDRVVIDPVSLYTVDTSQYRSMIGSLGFDTDGDINKTKSFEHNIDEDQLWTVFPYNFGYVFQSKKWAMLDMSNSSAIQFRTDAIDKLVLEQHKKDMLLALVTHNVQENNDIVDGKGGGVITLLHGAPGLGKTLAAEVIAEYTKKPLYKVSVGELGITPDELEERLSRILNIATRWGAVLLIDEADIFLEARTTNDIARNAMVAIFLRLLEYYEGVLFLTTNRVKNFDEAFYSRITLAFGFDQFTEVNRAIVWANLLDNSNIVLKSNEVSTLNRYDVNARQIKNAINGARAIALSRDEEPCYRHIKTMLDNATDFIKAVATDKTTD